MEEMYLVTGGAGNLGSSVIRELLARGKRVRTLVLPGDAAAQRLPRAVEKVEGDILDTADLAGFLSVPTGTVAYVVHCAGLVATVWGFDEQVFQVNVKGTENLVEQCLKTPIKKFVYTSSVHAIPEQPKGRVIREVNEFRPIEIVGFYGKSKAMASQIVMDAVHNRGLDATIVFPSGLCGPGDYAHGYVTELLVDSAANKLPAGVKGGYDFADVRDVAFGVVAACTKGAAGETYILGNRYVSVKEILELVHQLTSAKRVKYMAPMWLARLSLPLLNLTAKLRRRRPLVTRYALYTLTSNANFSSDKARMELGYTTRPFRETVADALEWLTAEGKLKAARKV